MQYQPRTSPVPLGQYQCFAYQYSITAMPPQCALFTPDSIPKRPSSNQIQDDHGSREFAPLTGDQLGDRIASEIGATDETIRFEVFPWWGGLGPDPWALREIQHIRVPAPPQVLPKADPRTPPDTPSPHRSPGSSSSSSPGPRGRTCPQGRASPAGARGCCWASGTSSAMGPAACRGTRCGEEAPDQPQAPFGDVRAHRHGPPRSSGLGRRVASSGAGCDVH